MSILLTTAAAAQKSVVMKGDTMIVNNDAKFWLNRIIYFGNGTMPDRTYSYIYEAPNPLQKLISNHRKKLMRAGFNGFKCKVVKFEKEIGHSKKDDNYTILVLELPDGKRYWCDIANAYNTNEIVLNEPENKKEDVTKTEDAPKPANTKKKTTNNNKSSKTAPVSIF
ncbi:MAG TPA: hypothetical protein VG847_07605 [Chitinophagaceae bacterium]|nr:hypothetical protein [Chitinophagaceae bacterium]